MERLGADAHKSRAGGNATVSKTRIFREMLTYCRRATPHFFDRGLTIATEVEPAVFAREALYHIRHASRKAGDRDDVLQFLAFAGPLVPRASGEFFQDLWALWEAGGKRKGFFVEFGAAGGKEKSNSYFLEKEMSWSGIVAEANPKFIEFGPARTIMCRFEQMRLLEVWGAHQVSYDARAGAVADCHDRSQDGHKRNDHDVVSVETISLNDLLAEGQAPKDIDFLSIDTEGSEYEILSNFDFDKWNIRAIAVEHNGTKMRGGFLSC